MRRVIDMIQMFNSTLGVTVRPVKHETRTGQPKFLLSQWKISDDDGTTCESAYFTSIHKTHVRRRDAFRGWRRDPDAESIRRWEDSRLWYEDKVRMKEEWNTKSYLRHGIPRPQCARSFEIYFARLAWKIYLLEVTSALALRDSRVLWRDLIGEH